MNYRCILVMNILAAALVSQCLFADQPISENSEIERFRTLQEKQNSAFQAHLVASANSVNQSSSKRNYGNFMHAEIAPVFTALYGDDYAEFNLGSLSSEELQARFKAFGIALFFRHSDSILTHMLNIVDELDARGGSPQEIAVGMFGNLIRARKFDMAGAFRARFSDLPLEPIPEIIDPFAGADWEDRKTVWRVSKDGTSLIRRELQLEGPQIVVYASLSCAHSRRFMAELPGQEMLSKIFGEHTIWIEPQDNDLHMQAIAAWNREHPDQVLQFMHSFSEWPEYEEWATPTFYFLDDGQIVKSVSGWPNWEGIIDGVEKIGLVAEDEIQPPDESSDE